MQVQPYLFFEGRCEEALEFYRRALGAEVNGLMRYREAPEPPRDHPVPPDKVMHASFRVGDTHLLASDGMCSGKPVMQGYGLAITAADDAEAKRRFDALADGGTVRMPLGSTFFASSFGMVADRFGVLWMVLAGQKG